MAETKVIQREHIRPNPGPQTEFLTTPASIAIYGGAAGGGKSWALLMEALRHVARDDYRADILRRTYSEIESSGGLWDASHKIYGGLAKATRHPNCKWTFPSGATIRFNHCQYESDKYKYQGAQIDLLGFDELTHFSEITDDDFTKVAQEILESPADRIVVDLRNNPGGFLDISIDVAGWFFEKGITIVTEETTSNGNRKHVSSGPGSLSDFPVVVLQNQGSASAAEILAGALRDNLGAEIVGEKSFGKGSVQAFENLPGGTSIKITVARWLTPSGQYINDKGIEPTIPVEFSGNVGEDGDSQKNRAIEVVKGL